LTPPDMSLMGDSGGPESDSASLIAPQRGVLRRGRPTGRPVAVRAVLSDRFPHRDRDLDDGVALDMEAGAAVRGHAEASVAEVDVP
jgi:hypothetical protein